MWISPWKSLAIRVGSMIGISALLLLAIFSFFFYQRTFQHEIQTVKHSLSQLVITVENSAAIASYLNNIEIAKEVVQGLERNDMVSGVSIRGSSGLYLESGNMQPLDDVEILKYPVISPVGDGESVGQITIYPNQKLIEKNAGNRARVQVLSMVLQTLIIVGLVMILVYWQLTNPILFTAQQLHDIRPGSRNRLHHPIGHSGSEIGELVKDTNELLDTVQNAIEKERSLRVEVESLERRFRLIFENASGGIALTDLQGKLLLHNPSFENMVGNNLVKDLVESGNKILPEIFIQNQKVKETIQLITHHRVPIAMDLKLLEHEHESRWLHCLFSTVENEEGNLLIETICYDISERTLREQQIQLEADLDPLTNLLNRRGGMRKLNTLLEKCNKERRSFTIFMIDLNKFKPINDTFGHEVGDIVLCQIAKRMVDSVRDNDLAVRLGGDEFLIALAEENRRLNVAPIAEKILNLLCTGIDIDGGQTVHIGGSMGISFYPESGQNLSSLMKQADNAMYRVKESGRSGYCFAQEEPRFIDRHPSA